MRKPIDITDKKFHHLTARKLAFTKTTNTNTRHYWLCECDCGEMEVVQKHSLMDGSKTCCKKCAKIYRERSKQRKTEWKFKGFMEDGFVYACPLCNREVEIALRNMGYKDKLKCKCIKKGGENYEKSFYM